VRREGRRLHMTEEGRPLVRAVCAVFDIYLARGTARHSVAV
jgi:oxygen-independent coproporphyrinogen-3 oxidase